MPTPQQISEAIALAQTKIAMAKASRQAKEQLEEQERIKALGIKKAEAVPHAPNVIASTLTWNAEQQAAIDNAFFGRSFCLIGAAGTGKTTTLRAILQQLMASHRIPPLHTSTKHLDAGMPGVALISYTRRAVRNIAKQMPAELKQHCMTYHKLMEYAPIFYEEWDDAKKESVKKMRFEPSRNAFNPLPHTLVLIIVDESSMLSIDYFNTLLRGLHAGAQVQFIFLGDLNQLPPVYGQAILGKKLLELPIIELTQVYRQALESPIIACALSVKNNNFEEFNKDARLLWGAPLDFDARNVKVKTVLHREGRGTVTLHPWKKELDKDDGLHMMQGQLRLWMKEGEYDPEQDLVLCPWNKSFGADELNLSIADYLAKSKDLLVHEVIAGFNKYYYAIGDKLLIDKSEALILDIHRNPRYLGKLPQPASRKLDRWGNGGSGNSLSILDEDISDADIDLMLSHASDVEDRTTEASHQIKVLFTDTGEEQTITQSATLNATTFAYAITVHKAQGSECRKVFVLTHVCHAAMCSRELIYTAITRAAEHLYIVMPPKLLAKAAAKPRIKGDTLAAKLEYFNSRLGEKDTE